MKKIDWVYKSRIGKGILFIFIGLALIFGKLDPLTSKEIGIFIIIFSLLFLFVEISLYLQVKKSKKSKEIKIPEHTKIVEYFENNNIKYIYKPKDEPDFEFFLPEYDVYIKYWKEFTNKVDREKIKKRAKKYELKFVEIFYDKIYSPQILHSSFMKRLSKQTRIR